MAITSTITLGGSRVGAASGTKQIGPAVLVNTASIDDSQLLTTINGNNTVAVPTGAVGVILFPPAANVIPIILKGVAGDTGISLHLTDASKISLNPSVTSFVLNVAGGISINLEWY